MKIRLSKLLSTVLAGAKRALKDEANGLKFPEFIEVKRRSLIALAAQVTALVSSRGASDVRHAENTSATQIRRDN